MQLLYTFYIANRLCYCNTFTT